MNRLRTRAVAPNSDVAVGRPFEAVRVDQGLATAVGGEFPSLLFTPIHYERNYAYPLVIWLHGDGRDERQLLRLMPQLSLRNYVAAAPRGTTGVSRSTSDAATQSGFAWPPKAADFAAAESRVFELIERTRRRYHVAEKRVFLAGADAGGTLALRLALAHPTQFAGALSFGGSFPTGRAPLARLAEARRLPLFIAYAREAADFSDEQVAEQVRLFYTACMQVMLRQYPQGRQLCGDMLADADRWMMNIVTGSGC